MCPANEAEQNNVFSEIIDILDAWQFIEAPRDRLVDKLYKNYAKDRKAQLLDILQETDETKRFALLESFLQKNWTLIKGSSLSYTACPNSEITQILCDIATIVSAYKNKNSPESIPVTPISLLMPGIALNSYHNDYPDLGPIAKLMPLNDDEQSEYIRLMRLYPNASETEIELNHTEHVALNQVDKLNRDKVKLKLSAIKAKDATINTTKLERILDIRRLRGLKNKQDAFTLQQKKAQDQTLIELNASYLQQNIPLITILRTHVLSADQQSLIPVLVLLDDLDKNYPTRPYHDLTESDIPPSAEINEMQRLIEHSNYSAAVYESNEHVKMLDANKNSLYDYLQELIKKLEINDSLHGRGQEINAAAGAYEAIRVFYEYYEQLGSAREDIPANVRREIELLLSLSSNPEMNINATENAETCIALRGGKLKAVTHIYAARLRQVACSDEQLNKQKNQARENLADVKQQFQSNLHRGLSEGSDKLPLNSKLLEQFNTSFTIQSIEDIGIMLELSETEIRDLLNPNEVKNLVDQFIDVEDFVDFIHDISIPKLKILLNFAGTILLEKLVKKNVDLYALLGTFGVEKNQVLLTQFLNQEHLRLQLSKFIHYAFNYETELAPEVMKELLEPLTLEQRFEVLELVDNYGDSVLYFIIESAPEIFKTMILDFLPKEKLLGILKKQVTDIGETVLHRLVDSFQARKLLPAILTRLSIEQQLEALNAIDLVKTIQVYPEIFKEILGSLSIDDLREFLQKAKVPDKILDIIEHMINKDIEHLQRSAAKNVHKTPHVSSLGMFAAHAPISAPLTNLIQELEVIQTAKLQNKTSNVPKS